MPFDTESGSFYQDRLGTHIGKALKAETRFLSSGGQSSHRLQRARL
jgi:hypothetical protein